jgi:hypothetical protein
MKPLYTTIDSVKVRLSGKVQFQSGAELLDGELPNDLLCQLISDAETEVEQDLRSRYSVPFRSITKNTFDGLPDHSKRAIRIVVDFKAVLKILETDFGRGTHVNAEGYEKDMKDRYEEQIMKLLGRDMIGDKSDVKRFKMSPPLEDMLLAANNRFADDGYRGTIINTDSSRSDSSTYAADNVNNPSKSYIRTRGFGGL